jgi:hypothetical protein
MVQRRITEFEVENTLTEPSISYRDPDGKPTFIGYPDGRRIKVVVAPHTNPPFIITVAD